MIHRTLLRLIVVAAAIAGGAVCRVQAQEEQPKPELILQQMLAAYADVQTYSDRSSVRYLNADGTERLTVDFRIWLARPVAFRVDATTTSPQGGIPRREVLWTDGSVVRTWTNNKPVQTRPKVQLVGSGMFGTYAYHVPTLLEAKYGGAKRLVNMESPQLAGVEEFEGAECYRVTGLFNGDPYELWIGRADHLVRKITAKYRDHQMEEIHREIAVNQPIALGDFRFRPEEEVTPQETSSPSPAKKSR